MGAWDAALQRVTGELAIIESGTQSQILGRYPVEIEALTNNLNALLSHERARQQRLDNTLGDLAHSLKTPLAVIQCPLNGDADQRVIQEQLKRMTGIVEYQLQRARSGNQHTANLAPPVPILATAERLITSLREIHRDKPVSVTLEMEPGLLFRGVDGDLMEMLGNLLENAFKWCHAVVQLRGKIEAASLLLSVDDDGPGLPAGQAQQLMERGTRADEAKPGHGIGLAVVREISQAYGGAVELGPSRLGGVCARLTLPI